jgi:hypothetical protein
MRAQLAHAHREARNIIKKELSVGPHPLFVLSCEYIVPLCISQFIILSEWARMKLEWKKADIERTFSQDRFFT